MVTSNENSNGNLRELHRPLCAVTQTIYFHKIMMCKKLSSKERCGTKTRRHLCTQKLQIKNTSVMPGEQEISIVLVPTDEYNKIDDFVYENFNDMPLFKAFETDNDKKPPPPEYGKEDFILKAQTGDGTIAGVAINRTKVVYQNSGNLENSWFQKMAEKSVSVLPVDTSELPIIHKFVSENFTEMPVYEAFGINDQIAGSLRLTSVPEEPYCLKAVRPDGTIVGVALCDEEMTIHVDENGPDEALKCRDFMKFVLEDSKITSLPLKTLELRILSVRPDCRGERIGKRLTEESANLAKSLGYQVIRICCASAYTEKIAKSLGWEMFYSMEYKDYGKKSGTNIVANPSPPHRTISYYIKRL